MWDHSSLTRGQTLGPAVEAQSLNHWITLEVLFCVPYLTHTHTHTRTHTHTHSRTHTQLQGDIHRWEVVPGVFKTHHNNRQLWLDHSRGPVGSSRWRLKAQPLGLTSCPVFP